MTDLCENWTSVVVVEYFFQSDYYDRILVTFSRSKCKDSLNSNSKG